MKPQIAIIMGSDSDLPVMQEAAKILDEFKVTYEMTVVSAHRTPQRMYDFAKHSPDKGIKVIIAGAGGSAHLPGMVAALTHLPVIGVPVQSKAMSGIDSLYSIVQMPPGVPVATVAINGAKNAGLLALQILSVADKKIEKALIKYKEDMETEVLKKAEQVEQIAAKNASIGFKL
ncbi:MAG: 5-(carboxyamino)imidazole ribonucleotide mutase [Bacteroidia bacterium]|nr:5-(carboxyamino)imidazole ribonucleotide mutase [Bacteroidia bacterium]